MLRWILRRRLSFVLYFLVFCTLYLLTIFVFHGQLQSDSKFGQTGIGLRHIHSFGETNKSLQLSIKFQRDLHYLKGSYPLRDHAQCNDSPKTKLNTFQSCNSGRFYVYSAYLDRRENIPTVRIVSILLKGKKNSLDISCQFNNDHQEINGTIYEMCENHNKRYGGYIISCRVPLYIVKPCTVSVKFIDRHNKETKATNSVLRIIEIEPKKATFDFGICVPPLFGDLKAESLVEFIELSRLLGAKHFIFYDFHIMNNRSRRILDFYEKQGVVTVIPWHLPQSIKDTQIWYHGQLLAHNDCMYRAMSLIQSVAVQDIDEFIIPHDGNLTWQKSLGTLLVKDVVGLSFHSAFFNPQSKLMSGLVTMESTSRTKLFSRVRTKVMIKPAQIFEIGIHHVSKPMFEKFKIIGVDTSIAYLHHYRQCVSNYGMKCKEFVKDKTLEKYYKRLKPNFDNVLKSLT